MHIGISTLSFFAIASKTGALATPSVTEFRDEIISFKVMPLPRDKPHDIFRDCSDEQVKTRSPKPHKPPKVSGLQPRAMPNRVISA